MTFYTQKAQVVIEIFTRDGQQFSVLDCYSYQSSRSLQHPAVSFSCQLRGENFGLLSPCLLEGRNICSTLHLYDLAKVWMRDGSGTKWLDAIGFVQRVVPTVLESEGLPRKGTQIDCVGLGEALLRYQIFWHPHLAAQNNLGGLGFLARSKGEIPKGRPDEVLNGLYRAFFNDKYVFTLADRRKIGEAIKASFEKISDSLSVTGLSALGMEGPVWDALKRYSDAPWNELFLDVGHEKNIIPLPSSAYFQYGRDVYLYLRPTPFSFARWRRLAEKYSSWGFLYDESERMGNGEQLNCDANDIYNFFWVPARGVFTGFDQLSNLYNQSGGKLPIYDEESICRYGLRRLEQATEYVEYDDDDDLQNGMLSAADKKRMNTTADKKSELLVRRTKQLQQWFGYDSFFKGTITTRGRIGTKYEDGGRIGGVLERKRDGMQFYITGIEQNWTFPGPHLTTFTVSRGHYPEQYKAWARKHVGKEYME